MNERIHDIASKFIFMVPIAMAVTFLWFKFQKSRMQGNYKQLAFDSTFMWKNVGFVGILTFLVMYLGQPLSLPEENVFIRPADF